MALPTLDRLPYNRISPHASRREELLAKIELNHRKFEDQIPWRWIAPAGPPKSCLVALHGKGQDGSLLARKLEHLTARGVALLIPDGPYRLESKGRDGLREGHAWYIYTGDQDRFLGSLQISEKDLLGLVEPILDQHQVTRSKTTLLGFSQGGYLAGFTACRNPQRFGHCVIASARLKHEFLSNELTSGQLPAVLMLHDKEDPLTQADPVIQSERILMEAGTEVQIAWHSDGHKLGESSLALLENWLQARGLLE